MRIDHTILFVDDDADDLFLMEEVLTEVAPNYKMETAHNGAEALEKIEQLEFSGELPCLIVLDLNMPKMNGKETLTKLRNNKRTEKLPVIMFSTASLGSQEDFYTVHNATYLEKPIQHSKLYKLVKQFLDACNNAREKLEPYI